MGSCLPSGKEVHIIPPTGEEGLPSKRSSRLPLVPGALPGEPGIPKQDPNAMRSRRNALLR